MANESCFPLDGRAIHLCIDMQRLFAEQTPWQVAWMPRVLPRVYEIARRHAERTVFTRFIPPRDPTEVSGTWRDYYEHWRELTRANLDPRLLDLAEPLAALAPPARVLDKMVYSAFAVPGFAQALRRRGVTTLVVSGGETDVCVLATVMGAVDLGFRVILATDALCSARDSTHDALITLYCERYVYQIEAKTTEEILSRWK